MRSEVLTTGTRIILLLGVCLSGLLVLCLPLAPEFTDSNLAEVDLV
jgi:hypothetical protein